MKQFSSAALKLKGIRSQDAPVTDIAFKPLMADSLEVMELYYKERITAFNEMLQYLNILENSSEIDFLCREITAARKALNNIHLKKNYSA